MEGQRPAGVESAYQAPGVTKWSRRDLVEPQWEPNWCPIKIARSQLDPNWEYN